MYYLGSEIVQPDFCLGFWGVGGNSSDLQNIHFLDPEILKPDFLTRYICRVGFPRPNNTYITIKSTPTGQNSTKSGCYVICHFRDSPGCLYFGHFSDFPQLPQILEIWVPKKNVVARFFCLAYPIVYITSIFNKKKRKKEKNTNLFAKNCKIG